MAKQMNEHEKWLRDYAAKIGQTYEWLLDATRQFLEFGEYIEIEGEQWYKMPDEFWDHYQSVLGRHVREENRSSFIETPCCTYD